MNKKHKLKGNVKWKATRYIGVLIVVADIYYFALFSCGKITSTTTLNKNNTTTTTTTRERAQDDSTTLMFKKVFILFRSGESAGNAAVAFMRFTQTEKETEKVRSKRWKKKRIERNWIQQNKMRNLQMLAEVANVQTVYAKKKRRENRKKYAKN